MRCNGVIKPSQDGVVVFAHVLGWPEDGLVQLGSVTPNPAIKVIFVSESCKVTAIQKVPGPDMIKVAPTLLSR